MSKVEESKGRRGKNEEVMRWWHFKHWIVTNLLNEAEYCIFVSFVG